jgi:YgiT-type zinc finger domain-containing protein
MKCVICKQTETKPGTTTVTLERDGLICIMKQAPAHVCPNCGEEYIDENTTGELLKSAEEIVTTGRTGCV